MRVKRERVQARQRAFRLTNRKEEDAERKKCRIVDDSS